jgi:hypothetical protein
MSEDDFLHSYLNSADVRATAESLLASQDVLDHQLGRYLEELTVNAAFRGQTPPLVMLGLAVDEIEHKTTREAGPANSEWPSPSKLRAWGQGFIVLIFKELRKIVCGSGRTPSKLGNTSQAAIAALATEIAYRFGINNPTALGVAVLVFLSLGHATKAALCRMTTPHELKELLERL